MPWASQLRLVQYLICVHLCLNQWSIVCSWYLFLYVLQGCRSGFCVIFAVMTANIRTQDWDQNQFNSEELSLPRLHMYCKIVGPVFSRVSHSALQRLTVAIAACLEESHSGLAHRRSVLWDLSLRASWTWTKSLGRSQAGLCLP